MSGKTNGKSCRPNERLKENKKFYTAALQTLAEPRKIFPIGHVRTACDEIDKHYLYKISGIPKKGPARRKWINQNAKRWRTDWQLAKRQADRSKNKNKTNTDELKSILTRSDGSCAGGEARSSDADDDADVDDCKEEDIDSNDGWPSSDENLLDDMPPVEKPPRQVTIDVDATKHCFPELDWAVKSEVASDDGDRGRSAIGAKNVQTEEGLMPPIGHVCEACGGAGHYAGEPGCAITITRPSKRAHLEGCDAGDIGDGAASARKRRRLLGAECDPEIASDGAGSDDISQHTTIESDIGACTGNGAYVDMSDDGESDNSNSTGQGLFDLTDSDAREGEVVGDVCGDDNGSDDACDSDAEAETAGADLAGSGSDAETEPAKIDGNGSDADAPAAVVQRFCTWADGALN